MAFVKLDCGILRSTLWIDRDARNIFVTALLMAEPHELTAPTATIQINSLEPADFTIPPGWYGFVDAASLGIISLAGLDRETGLAAVERLCLPENESRSPDFGGRRMARVDGGFIILNYDKYRRKDHTSSERSARYRARKLKGKHASRVTGRSVTQAEAYIAKTKTREKRDKSTDFHEPPKASWVNEYLGTAVNNVVQGREPDAGYDKVQA